MTYSEKLKDPRWQRKRLEILERDEFKCRECEDTTLTLHVHHGYYEKGFMPWEYPDLSMMTLCEVCHKTRQELELNIQKVFSGLSITAVVNSLNPLIMEEIRTFKNYHD